MRDVYGLGIFSTWALPREGQSVEETKTVWSLSRLPGNIVRLMASNLSFSAGVYRPKD
jgi:hypothetical protein